MRRAWLQKHPTPVTRDGAFHWYPANQDAELRASFAERLAGITVPAILWHHAPGRVAWASAFAATAPKDGRHYVGLALVVVDGDESTADLMTTLVPPLAAPWVGDLPPIERAIPCAVPDVASVARALLSGGTAPVGDVAHRGLPRAIAAIERVMPPCSRIRTGAWTEVDRARTADRVAELAGLAVTAPRSRAAGAWRLLVELAAATGRDVDTLAAEAENEVTTDWLTDLNGWGRGRGGDATTLADRVALRAFSHLCADRDPRTTYAEVRWRSLLPALRRAELLALAGKRTPSLWGPHA